MKSTNQVLLSLTVLAIVGCGETPTSNSSNSSDLTVSFKDQNVCGVTSTPGNVSVYILNDDNSIAQTLSLNSSGTASAEVSGDTVSLMVIRELSSGLDVYVAKDIDKGNLGTWYFDTEEKTGCNCIRDADKGAPVQVTIKPGELNVNHINWPNSTGTKSSTQADYTNLSICQSASAQDSEPLLVSFARVSGELKYLTIDTPSAALNNEIITIDIENEDVENVTLENETAAPTTSLTLPSNAPSDGQLFYVSDGIYEFSANYYNRSGANLLIDNDRVDSIRFRTSETQGNGTLWEVDLPLAETTSVIDFNEPSADESTLIAIANGTQSSFDFSSDTKQNATVEYLTINDGSKTDHWTIVQGVSGTRETDFILPEVYSASRSANYGTSTTNHSFSVIDLVGYDGYLYTDQGKALREIFFQSDSDQLKSLHKRGWVLDFEYHGYFADQ